MASSSEPQGGPSAGASLWTDDISAPPQNYYDVLGVAKDAEPEVIRKAYRRAALKCHPDKKGDDPVAADQFQKLSKAYEVLSDEKKRGIYDKYGPNGVEMMDKMPFLDVGMILAMKSMFWAITLLAAVLLLFPIFLSMKVDGKINWNWAAVFSPTFVVLGIAFLAVLFAPTSDNDEEDHESDRRQSKSGKLLQKLHNIVYVGCLLIFDVLIPVRLEGTITCSWAAVFVPWWILEASHFFSGVFSLVARVREGVFVRAPESMEEMEGEDAIAKRPMSFIEILSDVFVSFNFYTLRVIQTILLVVKVDDPESMSWARVSHDDGYPPAAVLLIPVFFVFSLILCCCGCFLPCVLSAGLQQSMDAMNAEAGAAGGAGGAGAGGGGERVEVPLARRIQAPMQSKTTLVN
ncbi:hypothetical protein HDU98_007764 [Podochytrium sp. JEL0797]|nr:hypothetical protein HDU98_007764 [Podochytrium sp. JEL0797]